MNSADAVHAQDIVLSERKIHYWQGGSGPALLLLHAAWGDADMSWSRVWDELARSYTVIAPDLPGFGLSDPLPRPALPSFAKAIKDLVDALHLDQMTVAGNSFGAGVAVRFV